MEVGVVTGFIPLPVLHLSEEKYHALGTRLSTAVRQTGALWASCTTRLERCWAYDLCVGKQPSNPPPVDRYPTPEVNIMSHIVQHQRTTWAMLVAKDHPEIDVWVWLDYGILKQGFWKNNPVTEDSVRRFIKVLQTRETLDFIPFPGIAENGLVLPTGNNWRFCGSTHIWPTQFLPQIDAFYKETLQKWISFYGHVPLDLPIWALVEQQSGLPFRWYPAEYDASQLDNIQGAL